MQAKLKSFHCSTIVPRIKPLGGGAEEGGKMAMVASARITCTPGTCHTKIKGIFTNKKSSNVVLCDAIFRKNNNKSKSSNNDEMPFTRSYKNKSTFIPLNLRCSFLFISYGSS